MVQFTALLAASLLAASVSAFPLGARTSLVTRAGTQFITGPCAGDGDCASGCCNARTALCAARFVAEENGGPGCGFGGGAPVAAPPPAAGGSGKPPGTQFITGPCGSDGDCASACCNARTGLCAARLVALEQGAGCGFGGAPVAAPPPPAAPAPPAAAPPAAGGSGKAPGTQFITGPCGGDGDCASGCCNSRTGLCAARLVAEENGGPGCGFGGAPVAAAPAPPAAAPPPATGGSGKPPGTQFITGPCGGDGDCASACCNARTGLCAARLVALEQGAGCGFGGAPAAAPAPVTGSGKPPGTQFITGPCGGDGDCASACCNARTGLCAARLVALEQGAGCGFGL